MAVPYHTHTFEIPAATPEEAAEGVISDKVVVPSSLPGVIGLAVDAAVSATTLYETRAVAEAKSISADIHSITTKGLAAAGDGLAGLYIDTDTGSDETFMTEDGRTWYRANDVGTERLTPKTKDRLGAVFQSDQLVQKKVSTPIFGLDNGVSDTQIYTGAQSAIQGLCKAKVSGVEKAFYTNRVSGASTNWKATERNRIAQFPISGDGSNDTVEAFSAELNIGHGGDLSSFMDGATLKFVSCMKTEVGHEDTDAGKGISIIDAGAGVAAVTDSDVTHYQLWGYAGSGHTFQGYSQCEVGLSFDGQTLFMTGNRNLDSSTWMFIYRMQDIISAGPGSSLSVPPISVWQIPLPPRSGSGIQGITGNNSHIFLMTGFVNYFGFHGVMILDWRGQLVNTIGLDGPRADYGMSGLLNHPTLGVCVQMEPEGCYWDENTGELYWGVCETWYSGPNIVAETWNGSTLNFAAIRRTFSGIPPHRDLSSWARTEKAATVGAYNPATVYDSGPTTSATRRVKLLYRVSLPRGESGEQPTDAGIMNRGMSGGVNIPGRNPDLVINADDTFQGKAYYENTQTYAQFLTISSAGFLGVFDRTEASAKTFGFGTQLAAGREIGKAIWGNSITQGAYTFWYGTGDSSFPGWIREASGAAGNVHRVLNADGTTVLNPESGFDALQVSGDITPTTTSTRKLGSFARKFLSVLTRNIQFYPGVGITYTPVDIGEATFEATSNTQVKLKMMGSDSVVRSVTFTLS